MRSVGGPASIVATVITLVLVPAVKDGKVHYHKEKVTVGRIQCERGTRIPPSPAARRLGVVGQICRNIIPRFVHGEDSLRFVRAHVRRARVRP